MVNAFVNSLIVTIPATVIPMTIAAFAAYAFAWMRFPGAGCLFALVVGLLVVPLQMTLVPLLRVYSGLDLNGTFLGVWLAHTGFGLPLAIFLLYNYISPAARRPLRVGVHRRRVALHRFTRLALPLSLPALASLRDLPVPLGLERPAGCAGLPGHRAGGGGAHRRLNELVGTRGEAWHLLTAGAFVTMVVPLIVFLGLQRYFVRGLLAGSVKG